MAFIGENEVRKKLNAVNAALTKDQLKLVLDQDKSRDYQAKVQVYEKEIIKGKAIIYYSVKKNSFKLRFINLDDDTLKAKIDKQFFDSNDQTGLTAYVDGSYLNGTTAYGVVLLKDNQVVKELNGILEAKDAIYHQIGGELKAALVAMKWALANGYQALTICYDYAGVKKFATNEWQAENELALFYQKETKSLGLDIKWVKIAAHTGDKWNERADILAKEAALNNKLADTTLPKAEKLGAEFALLLEEKGFKVENKGLINGQFVRLIITDTSLQPLYFDLYDTKNRPLIPYIHGKNQLLQNEVGEIFATLKKEG